MMIFKPKFLLTVFIVVLSIGFFSTFFNTYLYKTKAAEEPFTISFAPERNTINDTGERMLTIFLSTPTTGPTPKRMSGFDLTFTANQFLDITKLQLLSTSPNANFKELKREITNSNKTARFSYVVDMLPNGAFPSGSDLPYNVVLYLFYRGVSNGEGKIELSQYQVVGSSENGIFIPVSSPVFTAPIALAVGVQPAPCTIVGQTRDAIGTCVCPQGQEQVGTECKQACSATQVRIDGSCAQRTTESFCKNQPNTEYVSQTNSCQVRCLDNQTRNSSGVCIATAQTTQQQAIFSDISQTNVLFSIMSCFQTQYSSVVVGYPPAECPGGTACFKPERPITRAEAIAFISRYHRNVLNDWPADTTSSQRFTDVSPQHWAYQEIQTAAKNQFIFGYSDGTFRPNQQWRFSFHGVTLNDPKSTTGPYNADRDEGPITRGDFISKLYDYAIAQNQLSKCTSQQLQSQDAAKLQLKIKVPVGDVAINTIDANKIRVEVYDGSSFVTRGNVAFVRDGDYFKSTAPLSFGVADKVYTIYIKGETLLRRAFTGVMLRKGQALDCSGETDVSNCGELISKRNDKILFSGDADGFNTGSASYNKIDSLDLANVASFFNTSGSFSADFNLDGVVNIRDLEILGRNYLKSGD